jgi:hypothetical protein
MVLRKKVQMETQQENPIDTNEHIRITRLNTDKTRKTNEADVRYQVYFELSGTPVQQWRTIFEQEWKVLHGTQPQLSLDVNVDNRFLVVHCSLQEIADLYLPALKKAVDATNRSYAKYSHNAEIEQQRRDDVWTQERKTIDDIAKSLKFD